MPSALHAATVGAYRQILPQVARLIDKAEAHCRTRGLPDTALTEARIAPDMWHFGQQVAYVLLSSAGAIEALETGTSGPHCAPSDIATFAALRRAVAAAISLAETTSPELIEAARTREVVFTFGTGRMVYAAEDFLLSFALPNFFFHATTAYAILRHQGLVLGKRDFLGRVHSKPDHARDSL